jgi:hypothetical protein
MSMMRTWFDVVATYNCRPSGVICSKVGMTATVTEPTTVFVAALTIEITRAVCEATYIYDPSGDTATPAGPAGTESMPVTVLVATFIMERLLPFTFET